MGECPEEMALFTPRSWKRLRAHCLDELIEIWLSPSLGSICGASATWALPTQAMNLTLPDGEEYSELDDWCRSDLLALRSAALLTSGGAMMPLKEDEMKEPPPHLTSALRSSTKSPISSCYQCMFYILTILDL